MPTILQLSDATLFNLGAITVLRCEDGQWRVWCADPVQPIALTPQETDVLMAYLRSPRARLAGHVV
jgi:hypothetical protein